MRWLLAGKDRRQSFSQSECVCVLWGGLPTWSHRRAVFGDTAGTAIVYHPLRFIPYGEVQWCQPERSRRNCERRAPLSSPQYCSPLPRRPLALDLQHIALAIGEEVDLQTRLLDDLADDVDVTHTRVRAATARVKQVLKSASNWRGGLCIFLLIITLVVVIILTVKLTRFF
jgi:hypothetical protein